MKNISAALRLESMVLASTHPWLIFLDIILTDGPPATTLRLVRNNEDIVYGGNTYTAFPFDLEPTKMSGSGQMPTMTLKAANATRVIQGYVEALGGGVGSTVVLSVVHYGHLTDDYTDLTMTLKVMEAQSVEEWYVMTLGAPNPLNQLFTILRYIADHCAWRFQSVECRYQKPTAAAWQATHAYSVGDRVKKTGDATQTFRCYTAGNSGGSEPTWPVIGSVNITDGGVKWINDTDCKRVLLACQRFGNSKHFGADPSMGDGSVRIC